MKQPRKADVDRLRKMLNHLESVEQGLQDRYGDAVKGSWRAGQKKDAEALRRVLAWAFGVKEVDRG